MMRARALASQALKDNEPKAAVHAIDEGLDALKQHFSDVGNMDMFEHSNEVKALRGMRDALTPKLPVSEKSELRQRLQQAIEQENYELAAILRDELRMLKE
jgi:protein-arginine kinase activator protein McsA